MPKAPRCHGRSSSSLSARASECTSTISAWSRARAARPIAVLLSTLIDMPEISDGTNVLLSVVVDRAERWTLRAAVTLLAADAGYTSRAVSYTHLTLPTKRIV